MKELEEITIISMEEYKELLIIKGRYEELKSNQLYMVQENKYQNHHIKNNL